MGSADHMIADLLVIGITVLIIFVCAGLPILLWELENKGRGR